MLTAIYVRQKAEVYIYAPPENDRDRESAARLYRYHRLGSVPASATHTLVKGIYGVQSGGPITLSSDARVEELPYRKGERPPAPSPDAQIIAITFGDKDGWPDLALDPASFEDGATSAAMASYFDPLTVWKDL